MIRCVVAVHIILPSQLLCNSCQGLRCELISHHRSVAVG